MAKTSMWRKISCFLGFHDWIIAAQTIMWWQCYHIDYHGNPDLANWLNVLYRNEPSQSNLNKVSSLHGKYYRDGVCSHCDKTDVSYSKMLWELKDHIAAERIVNNQEADRINKLRQSLEETRTHVGPKLK